MRTKTRVRQLEIHLQSVASLCKSLRQALRSLCPHKVVVYMPSDHGASDPVGEGPFFVNMTFAYTEKLEEGCDRWEAQPNAAWEHYGFRCEVCGERFWYRSGQVPTRFRKILEACGVLPAPAKPKRAKSQKAGARP